VGDKSVENTLGADLRYDDIRNGLFLTQQRNVWGTVRDDAVKQGSIALWGESQIQWNETFRSIFGLRGDRYQFDVASNTAANSGKKNDTIVSPKLALIFGPWDKTEYFLNAGSGFHSNDARGTSNTVNPDPRPGSRAAGCSRVMGECTGDPISPVKPLVRARGYEAGVRSVWSGGLQSTLTLWRLEVASELLFTGDAGTTEASRPSRRQGVEWANYWSPQEWLVLDGDVSLSSARYTDASPEGNHVPGAVEQVASLGVSLHESDPWSAGLRLRYFGPRPLIEDNSVRSKASTLVNLLAGYRVSSRLKVGMEILNVFNRQVSDIDYYYASRLPGEAAPVSDVHTHPAEPRTLRVTLRLTL
jgi:outer membrane receptor protein involved in Fe transport